MLQSDRNDRNRNETEYRRKHYALSLEFDVCVVSLAEYYGKHRARHGRFHDDDCSEQRSSADDQLDEYQSYCRRDEELEQADIHQGTIRLSIGTEHIDDIIADLEKGFAAV